MKTLRCAIYTRKSSEEGLDQSFNSLDAQREACEAYIVSQKSEGWTALPSLYDDGGWSGGNVERPGLKRLLLDIEKGRIDVVVVYKVDRLTRSLADFARIIELFDRHGVSFVSVTQAFNTTSSMGRLTLNVLLSFAQFEREVTGERIRDKIAASKAKGMWMGGYPPLGYDPDGRSLVLNPEEAHRVRHIFERYLEVPSINALSLELEQQGIHSKQWTSARGNTRGGVPFSRGALFMLIRNRLYLGEIVHKGVAHPGQHEAIVDRELFEKVQAKLKLNSVTRTRDRTQRRPLTSLVFDAAGNRMSPVTGSGRGGRRYFYYVSAPLQVGKSVPDHVVSRVPALVLEEMVIDRLRTWFGRPHDAWALLTPLLHRVEVHEEVIKFVIRLPDSVYWTDQLKAGEQIEELHDGRVQVTSPVKVRTYGGRAWLIPPPSSAARKPRPSGTLIAALRRAHEELRKRGMDLAKPDLHTHDAKGVGDPYLRNLTRLAFLAPDIQRAILEGRQPYGLSLARLMKSEIPLEWAQQRSSFGF